MNNFLTYVFWGNSMKNWLIAAGCTILLFLIIRIFKRIIINKVRQMALRTAGTLDDALVTFLEKTIVPLSYLLAVYAGVQFLDMTPKAGTIISRTLAVVFTWAVLRLITSFADFTFQRHIRRQPGDTREKQGKGILIIFNIVIWILGLVFLIDNFGYNITTIITGLGVGGIAIALAAQTILGDLFSYLVIFFDKPFEIGDFIIVDDKMGSIEYIGIKTTRIRALSGEQLICSNSALTSSWLHNYKRMSTRRIVFSFGIEYNTPAGTVKKVPGIIRNIIEAQQKAKFDRAHLLKFGDSSLDFEVVYIVQDGDYNLYMDIQQEINLSIMTQFEREGINFAHPTRILHFPRPQLVNS
ncbi:MAG: mechanosensitive ion channel family protein [Bacteroidetes bacterium]|nr:mechanosensitive ion channel family protein [Bacteroidota bacterium]